MSMTTSSINSSDKSAIHMTYLFSLPAGSLLYLLFLIPFFLFIYFQSSLSSSLLITCILITYLIFVIHVKTKLSIPVMNVRRYIFAAPPQSICSGHHGVCYEKSSDTVVFTAPCLFSTSLKAASWITQFLLLLYISLLDFLQMKN